MESCELKSLATKLAKWFKSLPFLGRQRFWILYWAYRLTGWHIRHKEWDFVLEYLPPLEKCQKVRILDVGCSRNLICHEIFARGYKLMGVDLEQPDFEYPGYKTFFKLDVRKPMGFTPEFSFVICISVLEHIEGETGQKDALNNMIASLKVGGRLLLTIPTHEFAQGHPWHGFSGQEIADILPHKCRIINCNEKAGQICMAIERICA